MNREELISKVSSVLRLSYMDTELHGAYIVGLSDDRLLVMNIALQPLGHSDTVTQVFENVLLMAQESRAQKLATEEEDDADDEEEDDEDKDPEDDNDDPFGFEDDSAE